MPGCDAQRFGAVTRSADVNVVAAFDVDKEKVGVDINEAIFAKTNNALRSTMFLVRGFRWIVG